jgi:hypothetical protein
MSALPHPIPAPVYAPFRCRACGCNKPATQTHHITYDPRVPQVWAKIGVCADHHERLHDLHELVRGEIPLLVFSHQYLADPERISRWARNVEKPAPPSIEVEPVHPQQLSWGDLMGPGGEYWRQFEDDL